MERQKNLIVIVGPTAVGKTALCIGLAQQLQTEIISADARQFYRKMNIGVAKPTLEEQAAVPHHLIDFLPLEAHYSAGTYERDVRSLLCRLWKKHACVILTGGSGLYVQAVCKGLPYMPIVSPSIYTAYQERYQAEGLTPLLEELRTKDPIYYSAIDKKNPKRIIRALSICQATQKPFSFFRRQEVPKRDFNIIKIGLTRSRAELYERINMRVDDMIREGLWEEATALYPQKGLSSLATIGYREIFDCLEGKHSQERAIELIKQNTRHYAKRQGTWFRKDRNIAWFHPKAVHEIAAHINEHTRN